MAVQKTTKKTPKLKLTAALKKKGVKAHHVKKVNQSGKTIMIVVEKAPTGRTTADRNRVALKPGKRLTAKGSVYTEKRANRSDNKKFA